LSLEIWQYLAEHPSINCKENLPYSLFEKIKHLKHRCPLCELPPRDVCKGELCPLKSCTTYTSYFNIWSHFNKEFREVAARGIVDAIQAWEPEETEKERSRI